VSWLQLRLDTAADQAQQLEERLLAAGAVAVTLQDSADQPLLEPGPGETPLWRHIRLTALYPADTDMARVLAALPAALLAQAPPRVEILEDRDWEREWMRHYRPLRFGRRLWVCPSWLAPPDPDAVNLLLDPGLAFGTGTHPTTGLCLAQLEHLCPTDATVVDYGCGSGILALAALRLGAARALAVDNDPQALAASRENARRNAIEPQRLELALPGQDACEPFRGAAGIVVANILAGPLTDLADTLADFLQPGGTLLLSGLLESQADALIDRYAPRVQLRVAAQQDGWVCLRGGL